MSNISIAIPPFPSQDLAKLVLGYLAEEQLMTAYDEFLQASPYLDALRNEYDRIFMTSLKNILAEYRAVKIFVETCKPFILRKKLFQCTNLLEIVKFLVNNVDVNKLHMQEGTVDKVGSSRQNLPKSNPCDVCVLLKLPNCGCKNTQSTSQIEASSLEGSVETTSLSDLPGNTSYKKNIAKEAENKYLISHSITSSDQGTNERSAKPVNFLENLSSTTYEKDTADNVISSVNEKIFTHTHNLLVKEHPPEMRQNLQDSNNILNLINSNISNICEQNTYTDNTTCATITVERLQDSVTGDNSNINKVIVPDSSTSENIGLQTPIIDKDNVTISTSASKGIVRPPPQLIKIGNEQKHMNLQSNIIHSLPRLASKDSLVKTTSRKIEDQNSPKITILSDVKVDNDIHMPPILKATSSTSLVPMQTLFINGTPAYKNAQQVDQTFTKDEIMAMPTIIIVPASDKNKKIVPTVTQNNTIRNSSAAVSCSAVSTLEPLVIDVSSNHDSLSQINNMIINNSEKPTNDNMLIKTVDVTSVTHASLPKDNTLPDLKTSTPHVHPPTRKSSSTPRRTSHVRVLDFTTPRRILHETLNEQEGNQCPSIDVPDAQASSLPSIKDDQETVNKAIKLGKVDTNSDSNTGATKENKASIKLYNWDAQLRALAYVGNGNIEKSTTTRKSKSTKSKRKETETNKNIKSGDSKVNKSNDHITLKFKNTKPRKSLIKPKKTDTETQTSTVPVLKPTINIISRKKGTEPIETEKDLNKSLNIDANTNTPELEKMSLQNEIGIKLNISDLLETPYKQAMYEIQMETPKFLGPDIPGDPLSDIKIMNIPTPRFLNTPKLVQNTPSSYSSRPTDYSSGGSYYKPDDQDYVLGNLTEDLPESGTTSKNNDALKTSEEEKANVDMACEGKTRPVRQCTKNVSYNYGTTSSSKTRDAEDKMERSSTCSENSISKPEKKKDKHKIAKIDKDNVGKQRDPKKKSKKYKSPVKKDTPKTFMKIKPRRTTPVKEVLGKGKKRTSDLNQTVYTKQQPKKISAGKERNPRLSPLTVLLVPNKSRRKSSTPRKLHCTKRFNLGASGVNSPERKKNNSQMANINAFCTQESDSEQPHLRWSDDGSQDSKIKAREEKEQLANESDDINRIKEYIQTTLPNENGGPNSNKECEGNLQVDLIKRGFDIETARMIERDLLETHISNRNTPVHNALQSMPSPISNENEAESKSKNSDKSNESDCSTSNNLQIDQDDDCDDIDFSVQDCNEDTENYFTYNYDESNFIPSNQIKFKETFSMEICIENDVTIRLRAMPFNTGFEQDPDDNKSSNEKATNSIINSNLYTPRKAQCYELFDSTLASLDTPIKLNSPKANEFKSVTEIVLEVEKLSDIKSKPEGKKRKRVQIGASEDISNSGKKVKPDTSYLLNSAGIQNIDIESVLSKLHGP